MKTSADLFFTIAFILILIIGLFIGIRTSMRWDDINEFCVSNGWDRGDSGDISRFRCEKKVVDDSGLGYKIVKSGYNCIGERC